MTPALVTELKRLGEAYDLDLFNKALGRQYVDACVAATPALLEAVETMHAALENAMEAVEAAECRGDEDCDHCFIVHEVIDPALARVAGLLEKGREK